MPWRTADEGTDGSGRGLPRRNLRHPPVGWAPLPYLRIPTKLDTDSDGMLDRDSGGMLITGRSVATRGLDYACD